MAMTFEELIATIETKGAEKARRDVKGVSTEVGALGDLLTHLGTLGGLTVIFSQFADLLRGLGQVSGVGVAAQFQSVAFALQSVTRNSASALRIWQQLKDLGGSIGVDPTLLGQQASQMIGLGVPQASVVPELTKLTDALAYARVNSEDMSSVMFNLLQIRAMGSAKASFADIRQMLTRAPGTATLLAQGLGVQPDKLMGTLRGKSMSGSQVYEALMKGTEAIAQGAAASRALHDPLFAVASLFLTLRQSMEPTGQIIIAMAAPFIRLGRFLAEIWKKVNELSGGFFGLAALMGGALFIATRQATVNLLNLVAALVATATAAKTTAGAQTMAAGGSAAAGLGGAAAAGAGAGIASRLVGFAARALRAVGIGALVAGLSDIVGSLIAGDRKSKGRSLLGDLIGDIGVGVGLGAAIGSLVPGVGTLIGGIIGGLFGALSAILPNVFGKGKAGAAGDPVARNTERMAQSLDEIKGHFRSMGGGKRTASAISSFQLEWQIAAVLGI